MASPVPVAQALRSIWSQVHGPLGLAFPDTLAALRALQVARYHIDYVGNTATSYVRTPSGSWVVDVAPIPSHGGDAVAEAFTLEGVKTAIARVQRGETKYAAFSAECIRAGVVGYITFIEGEKVVYYGNTGDMHVEWFPGAKRD